MLMEDHHRTWIQSLLMVLLDDQTFNCVLFSLFWFSCCCYCLIRLFIYALFIFIFWLFKTLLQSRDDDDDDDDSIQFWKGSCFVWWMCAVQVKAPFPRLFVFRPPIDSLLDFSANYSSLHVDRWLIGLCFVCVLSVFQNISAFAVLDSHFDGRTKMSNSITPVSLLF